MRQLVIDDLTREERDNIESYFRRNLQSGALEGSYWLPLPVELEGEAQSGHAACGPFFMGVELGESRVAFELLVRSHTNLHCSCISYATAVQRQYLLEVVDRMLVEEMISA
ncbi:MAG: hypothetical protein KJ950_14270 [Proteobacteria bacterium]|nr:hypothetical protein [Pseudomonadota bacterium]MBU1685932.1 hypothetical protein [Pseudomonadota bacterium]